MNATNVTDEQIAASDAAALLLAHGHPDLGRAVLEACYRGTVSRTPERPDGMSQADIARLGRFTWALQRHLRELGDS